MFESSLFILIDEGSEEVLIFEDMFTGFLPHKGVCLFVSVDLICNRSEETVAVTTDVSKLDFEHCDLFVEALEVVHILSAEFEVFVVGTFAFLLKVFLLFAILLTLLTSLLYLVLSVAFFPTHNSLIYCVIIIGPIHSYKLAL